MDEETAALYSAMGERAAALDRLYLAIDAAYARWLAAPPGEVYDRYQDYRDTQRGYADYRALCTAAPLDPLLESAAEEEEQP